MGKESITIGTERIEIQNVATNSSNDNYQLGYFSKFYSIFIYFRMGYIYVELYRLNMF